MRLSFLLSARVKDKYYEQGCENQRRPNGAEVLNLLTL